MTAGAIVIGTLGLAVQISNTETTRVVHRSQKRREVIAFLSLFIKANCLSHSFLLNYILYPLGRMINNKPFDFII